MRRAGGARLTGLCGGLFGVLVALARAGDDPIRLPATDAHYGPVKDYVEAVPDPDYRHAPAAAVEAFKDIKYGVRIHWGLYSAAFEGGESWPFLDLPFAGKQEYEQAYKTWNPRGFDAEEWMRLFKDNGLRLFAFTSKHHDGFSMFATRTRVRRRVNWTAAGGPRIEDCDLAYSIAETPFRRDVVGELCAAAHRYGVKIDLYFSHPDWYDADFRPYGFSPITTRRHRAPGALRPRFRHPAGPRLLLHRPRAHGRRGSPDDGPPPRAAGRAPDPLWPDRHALPRHVGSARGSGPSCARRSSSSAVSSRT